MTYKDPNEPRNDDWVPNIIMIVALIYFVILFFSLALKQDYSHRVDNTYITKSEKQEK